MKNLNSITRNSILLLFIFGVSFTLAVAQPTLYTTTSGSFGGTRAIITYDGGSNSIDTVYKFSSNNDEPWGALMQASNGKIYGNTILGGAYNKGRLFEFHPETNTVTTVHDFNGSDGQWPVGAMTEASNGKLYGMCIGAAAYVDGVVYEYDYVNDIFTVKTVFYESDGGLPYEPFVEAPNHKLYSITTTGGTNYQGALVEYDYINNIFTARHLFNDNSGWHEGGITMAGNGKFYGANIDNIFEYDYITDTYTVKAPMASATGFNCNSDLVLAPNGKMYGIASAGGANDDGTIFEYDYINDICIKKMDLSTVTPGYGSFPSLFLASNGKMYGLTQDELFEYDYINNVFTKGNHLDLSTGNKPLYTNFMEQYSLRPDSNLAHMCVNESYDIHFVVTGPFLPNNVFTAQISDSAGSFANPTALGTLAGMSGGTIHSVNINTLNPASGYRIRIVSSAPVYISPDNGSDLSIYINHKYLPDADGDGYGTGSVSTSFCIPPSGWALVGGDCNDNNAAIHPGATETCNSLDDDCDSQIDEGATALSYADGDQDGFGDPAISSTACPKPVGYVSNNTDCDDANGSIHTAQLYYVDADLDGYGSATTALVCSSVAEEGYSINNFDCNDANANAYPDATEVCGNGMDDNCNTLVDEDCCTIPTGLSTTNISATGVTLNWSEVPGAVKYKFQYKIAGESVWHPFSTSAPVSSYHLTGLAPATTYKWKVRSICNGTKSIFSPLVKFTTLAAKATEELNEMADAPLHLNIYPNPSQGNFSVRFDLGNGENGNAVLQIYNAMGQTVYETTTEVTNGLVDQKINATTNLASGNYFVQMIFGQKVYVGKMEVVK